MSSRYSPNKLLALGLSAIFMLSSNALAPEAKLALAKRQVSPCTTFESSCGPNGSDSECVSYICNTGCIDLSRGVGGELEHCCNPNLFSTDADTLNCVDGLLSIPINERTAIATAFAAATVASAAATTSEASTAAALTSGLPASITADPSYQACVTLDNYWSQCESLTPGFTDLTAWSALASCFCYTSSTYEGSVFDQYYSSCNMVYSTYDYAAYTNFYVNPYDGSVLNDPCSFVLAGTSAGASAGGTTSGSLGSITLTDGGGALPLAPTLPSKPRLPVATSKPTPTSTATFATSKPTPTSTATSTNSPPKATTTPISTSSNSPSKATAASEGQVMVPANTFVIVALMMVAAIAALL